MVRVCFVCLGNICRSPTAEAVMRHLVEEAGLSDRIKVESAGTGNWHAGEPPDSRARAAARKRNIDVSGRARQFEPKDWERFDYVLALDAANYSDLLETAPNEQASSRLALLRSYDVSAPKGAGVPDPYFGAKDGFETVLDQCDAACRGLLNAIRREHDL